MFRETHLLAALCTAGLGRGERPQPEHRVDLIQVRLERVRLGQVGNRELDAVRESVGVRVARDGAHRGTALVQLGDDLAADVAGRAGDEDHARASSGSP